MNCEQVEELLSAYLDNMLASGERRSVTAHLQSCEHCSDLLADFRHFDTLLSQLPRVSPSPALRERIFSSPEYAELLETSPDEQALYKQTRRDTPGRPQLVALPGGRRPVVDPNTLSAAPTLPSPIVTLAKRQRRSRRSLHIMQAVIAAALLLTIGVGSLIGWKLWMQQANLAKGNDGITPPAGPPQNTPLSAGMRLVFLRGGILWSTPIDGSSSPQPLTLNDVRVAAGWAVGPPLAGRSAGDLLAYIDLQQAMVHTIRSDGLRDTAIKLPLLKAGTSASSVWDTDMGAVILNSLAWSSDGKTLAFVADATGAGQTRLYLFSTETGKTQLVPSIPNGSVSHPVWSPDGVRVAFEVTHNGMQTILDYNTQKQSLLTITDSVNTSTNSTDTILTLDWSASIDAPTITWSVGVAGHIHSLWMRRVGIGGSAAPHLLITGDYVQASYSRAGDNGVGSWLLVASLAGRPSNLSRLDLTGTQPIALTSAKQVSFARWSPNGASIDYFDALSSGMGTLHVINLTTGADTLMAARVVSEPLPAWSMDSQTLAYSTGKQVFVVNLQAAKQLIPLPVHGLASAFIWSPTSSHQLVVSLSDGQQGVYLVDTQGNTSLPLDKQSVSGPIEWNEVP